MLRELVPRDAEPGPAGVPRRAAHAGVRGQPALLSDAIEHPHRATSGPHRHHGAGLPRRSGAARQETRPGQPEDAGARRRQPHPTEDGLRHARRGVQGGRLRDGALRQVAPRPQPRTGRPLRAEGSGVRRRLPAHPGRPGTGRRLPRAVEIHQGSAHHGHPRRPHRRPHGGRGGDFHPGTQGRAVLPELLVVFGPQPVERPHRPHRGVQAQGRCDRATAESALRRDGQEPGRRRGATARGGGRGGHRRPHDHRVLLRQRRVGLPAEGDRAEGVRGDTGHEQPAAPQRQGVALRGRHAGAVHRQLAGPNRAGHDQRRAPAEHRLVSDAACHVRPEATGGPPARRRRPDSHAARPGGRPRPALLPLPARRPSPGHEHPRLPAGNLRASRRLETHPILRRQGGRRRPVRTLRPRDRRRREAEPRRRQAGARGRTQHAHRRLPARHGGCDPRPQSRLRSERRREGRERQGQGRACRPVAGLGRPRM